MFAAIDPLAVILPTRVYLALIEKLHPNEPPIRAIEAALAHVSAEERRETVHNAKRVAEFANAVLKAAGGPG